MKSETSSSASDVRRRYARVRRIDEPSAWHFVRKYLAKNEPVVVRDARDDWPAFREWTPRSLAERLGDVRVTLSGDFFNTIEVSTLHSYVARMEWYDHRPVDEFSEAVPVPYLRDTPAAERCAEDFEQVSFRTLADGWRRRRFMPKGGHFRPFHLLSSVPHVERYPGFGIFVSPRGAVTRYHVDLENDSNLLTQVHGRKRGFLFPPRQGSPHERTHSFAGRGNLQRVLAGEDPDYSPYQPLEFELGPGDSVLLPRGWGHEVFTLSQSISLTYNFVHVSELDLEWLKYWLRGRNLEGGRLKRVVR